MGVPQLIETRRQCDLCFEIQAPYPYRPAVSCLLSVISDIQLKRVAYIYVGDAFQFINHIPERRQNTTGRSGVGVRRLILKSEIRGWSPASTLSLSHIDVGDAFQIINQISTVRVSFHERKADASPTSENGKALAGLEPPVL